MKPSRIEKEMRSFKIVQKCGYIGCSGEFEGVAVHSKNGKFIHECTECNELILLDKEHPYLEYEEIELVVKETSSIAKNTSNSVAFQDNDDFDDDIPF